VTSAGGANVVATAAAGDGAARDGADGDAAGAGTAAVAAAVEADWANRYRRRPRPSPCAGGPCAGLSGA